MSFRAKGKKKKQTLVQGCYVCLVSQSLIWNHSSVFHEIDSFEEYKPVTCKHVPKFVFEE